MGQSVTAVPRALGEHQILGDISCDLRRSPVGEQDLLQQCFAGLNTDARHSLQPAFVM